MGQAPQQPRPHPHDLPPVTVERWHLKQALRPLLTAILFHRTQLTGCPAPRLECLGLGLSMGPEEQASSAEAVAVAALSPPAASDGQEGPPLLERKLAQLASEWNDPSHPLSRASSAMITVSLHHLLPPATATSPHAPQAATATPSTKPSSRTLWSQWASSLVSPRAPAQVVAPSPSATPTPPSLHTWEQWHIHLHVCHAQSEAEQAQLLGHTRAQVLQALRIIAEATQRVPCPPLVQGGEAHPPFSMAWTIS